MNDIPRRRRRRPPRDPATGRAAGGTPSRHGRLPWDWGLAAGLLVGVAADAVFADPARRHPVAGFGKMARYAERLLYRDHRLAGVAHTGLLVAAAAGFGALAEWVAAGTGPGSGSGTGTGSGTGSGCGTETGSGDAAVPGFGFFGPGPGSVGDRIGAGRRERRRLRPVARAALGAAATMCTGTSGTGGVAMPGSGIGSGTGTGVGSGRREQRRPWRPVARAALVAAATWTVLGGTTLRRTGRRIAADIACGDLPAARRQLPSLCGRDPSALDTAGLARAAVESLAENTSDAAVAPLLWGAVAGIPGLLGYRAVNTLDAMVGYRNARYGRFGWAAARLDDVANFVPARLAALLACVCAPAAGGAPADAYWVMRRDGHSHPSPNAGQVEAAFAGALGVRLGGQVRYPHGVEDRPHLGFGRIPTGDDVERAADLSGIVTVAASGVCVAVCLVMPAVSAAVVSGVSGMSAAFSSRISPSTARATGAAARCRRVNRRDRENALATNVHRAIGLGRGSPGRSRIMDYWYSCRHPSR